MILKVSLTIILIIFILLFLLIVIPFRYRFFADVYENGDINVDIKCLFLNINIAKKNISKARISIKLLNIAPIFDSQKANEKKEQNKKSYLKEGKSISTTKFIKDKNIDKELLATKDMPNRLLAESKKFDRFINKSKITFDTVKDFFSAFVKTLIDLKDKLANLTIKQLFDKLFTNCKELLKKIFHVEDIRAIKRIIGVLCEYGNAFLPNDINADIRYGLGDPYLTGLSLILLTPLFVRFGDKFKIRNVLLRRVFACNVKGAGYIHLLIFLKIIIILLLDKKVRKFIFKRRVKKNGNKK